MIPERAYGEMRHHAPDVESPLDDITGNKWKTTRAAYTDPKLNVSANAVNM